MLIIYFLYCIHLYYFYFISTNGIIFLEENGLIIPTKIGEALYQAMQRFIDEPNLIAKMKVNARPMVIDRFEQKYIWNELLKVYKSFDE